MKYPEIYKLTSEGQLRPFTLDERAELGVLLKEEDKLLTHEIRTGLRQKKLYFLRRIKSKTK